MTPDMFWGCLIGSGYIVSLWLAWAAGVSYGREAEAEKG